MSARRIVSAGPALVVAATALAGVYLAPLAVRNVRLSHARAEAVAARDRLEHGSVLEAISAAVADLSQAVAPSVVHIEATGERLSGGPYSEGAGWVYDDTGHIVTNSHVVRGAERITVQFSDGRVSSATFVGDDRATDIAVIKVDRDAGLIAASRAPDDSLRQGDRVYAFGSPFGFKFSMSEGIVSGLGRAADGPTGEEGYSNFIQTDAAANPGNSGGPLVDVRGRVAGMITAIVTASNTRAFHDRQGQSAGVGFAIPVQTIEAVVGQIVSKGIVLRGYMGVALLDIDRARRYLEAAADGGLPPAAEELPELLRGIDLTSATGVIVSGVLAGQPAAKAGLRAGDLITHVNGARVRSSDVLRSRISVLKPGGEVRLGIVRAGKTTELDVTLGAAALNAAGQLEPVAAPADEPRNEL